MDRTLEQILAELYTVSRNNTLLVEKVKELHELLNKDKEREKEE